MLFAALCHPLPAIGGVFAEPMSNGKQASGCPGKAVRAANAMPAGFSSPARV